jgi:hypothetical protein
MEKEYARFMKWGKLVKNTSNETFKLVEDMNNNSEIVKAVSMDNLQRYELLKAWIRNWEQNIIGFRNRFTENIEDCKIESKNYEVELRITELEPANKVRFITPNYEELFTITDLDYILVNGELRRVIYLDEYHFQFEKGNVYHICQWAELCEKNKIEISKETIQFA